MPTSATPSHAAPRPAALCTPCWSASARTTAATGAATSNTTTANGNSVSNPLNWKPAKTGWKPSSTAKSRISLGASKQGAHRSEYGFTLGSDARVALDIPAINAHFAAHGHPLHLSDKHRHIRYLRGEIDHLYQHYILDYKTNHLGNSPADYTPENIRAAMGDHHYWLQAALYQVALHRLLQTRLADYDPARHLGGIEYLYLRGIDPAHPANGKYGWNYPPEFIAGLDRILGHEAA